MKAFYQKYKEAIIYIFFGVLATLVNMISYHVFFNNIQLGNVVSTILAWVLAFLFAFFTNKFFVFKSKAYALKAWIYEFGTFFLCRVFTGVLDVVVMYLGVDLWGKALSEGIFIYGIVGKWIGQSPFVLNSLVIKLGSNFIVMVLNYIASKLIIFNKKRKAQ